MESNTPLDIELQQRAAAARAAALELIARTKPRSAVAAQIPAVVLLALLAALSYTTGLNAAPYIALVLIPPLLYLTGCIVRMQRRMEALVQLVVQDKQP